MSEGTDATIEMESCQFCPYLNKDPTKLARHVKGVHLQIRNLECDRCDYKASEKGTLKLHIKAAHDKTMPDKVREIGICSSATSVNTQFSLIE